MNLTLIARLAAIVLALLFVCSCSSSSGGSLLVIEGATLFDGTGSEAVKNSTIVIDDKKIACAGTPEECNVPDRAEVIDASGRFITPGLIDAHVHFFQTGFFDSRPDALDLRDTYPFSEVAAYQKQNPQRYYDSYLCSGVIGVYDVGGFTWSIDFQQEAEENPNAPHVAASGPLITPSSQEAFNTPADKVLVTLDSEETGREAVRYLSELGATGIKLWQLKTGSEEYMDYIEALADEIEKHDNKMIAHATTLEQAKAAVENGTELLVHSVSDTLIDEEFIHQLKEKGTIYTPTLIVGSGYMRAYRAAAGIADFEIDDPRGCVDAQTRELLESADQFKGHERFSGSFVERLESFDAEADRTDETDRKNLKKVYEAGIPIAVGTDAGNPGTLHGISIFDELEAMQEAGIPAKELIVMATQNGAIAMERADDFGTLEPGKLANLVIMDENPTEDIANMRSIRRTMIKGNFVND